MSASIPNKEELISAIRQNVPSFLLEQPIWLAYYYKSNKDGTFSKPPVKGYSVKDNEPGKTFEHVIKDGYPGIKINKHNNIVAVDIDDKPAKLGKRPFSFDNLSQEFRDFIADKDSYMEWSPSKCGLRILYKIDDKSELPGRVNLNSKCIGGELFVNSGYVTITGKHIAGSNIVSVTTQELKPWYSKNGSDPIQHDRVQDLSSLKNLPSLSTVLDALHRCRLDQSSGIKKAYESVTGQEYNHYEYWIKIMSAVHHFSTLWGKDQEKILADVVEWSQTDLVAYEDEEDVITHWMSFNEKPNSVTYHTLFKFARLTTFQWPKEKFDKKGQPTGKPLLNEYVNFEYLINYYEIEFFHEPYSNALYISADDTIMEKYFSSVTAKMFFGKMGPFTEEEIIFKLWRLAQDNHYDNVTFSVISPLARSYLRDNVDQFNLLEKWLSTESRELPKDLIEHDTSIENSTIDHIISCIRFNNQQNVKLARVYLKAFFFGIVMPIYNPKRIWPEHNFMLILTGPENCRKTSFFNSIVPLQLKDVLISHPNETMGSGKSIRDFMIHLTSSAIMVIDEFETLFNKKNESMFKSLVTCDSVDYVPIYSKTSIKAYRTAALAGTTNQHKLPLEQDSSRRVAMIEVDWIDTDKLRKVNWHHFYRELVRRGKELMKKNIYPWKLSQEDIDTQYQENERFRAPNDLEIIIKELYDFEYEFPGLEVIKSVQTDTTWLSSSTDISGTIKQRYPSINIKPSALRNTLERLCGKWTRTKRLSREMPSCAGHIQSGVVKQKKYTRYFMPPKLTEFKPE
jgi:hypothetical protein